MEWTSRSAEETRAWGEQLGRELRLGDWLALTGSLGSGKTTLVQGVVAGLGVPRNVVVSSPTFVLVQEYQGRCPIFHVDLYRLAEGEHLDDLGCREWPAEGVVLMEWADRASDVWPVNHVRVHLQHGTGDERMIQLLPGPAGDPERWRECAEVSL